MTQHSVENRDRSTETPAATSCPICGEEPRAQWTVKSGLSVAQCAGCGLVSLKGATSPAASDTEQATKVPRFLFADTSKERKAAQRYLMILRARGPGGGRLLLIAPTGHPFAAEAQVAGFEIGLQVSLGELEKGLDLGQGYDAALVLYQLERASEPLELLSRVYQALGPGAFLLVATPARDSLSARLWGKRWNGWRPENRFYFDKETIQSLLQKSGFAEIEIDPELRGVSSSGMVVSASRVEMRDRPLLSIILPVYNERETFTTLMGQLLDQRLPGIDREIILIESNSRDGTREAVLQYQDLPEVKLVLQPEARGKGNAVREGLDQAQGDIVLIQDADLEYDLDDYPILLEPLLAYRSAFVLGARLSRGWKVRDFDGQRNVALVANLAHLFFVTLVNVLYGQHMKDPLTMYKVFRRDCLHGLVFECNRFDFDYELVIKLVRKGYKPLEIPVKYRSRSFRQGKKVNIGRDPLTWLWAILKYRFARLTWSQSQ